MRTPTALKSHLSKPLTINIPSKQSHSYNYHSDPTMDEPVEIVKGLYLGSASASRNKEQLERCGIRLVVNCATELANHFEDKFSYFNCNLKDEEYEDALAVFHNRSVGEVIDFVRRKGDSVLVHCQAGISRSVTIVIAYLMMYHKMTLKDSFLLVKSRRPPAGPNKGYMKQLGDLERNLTGLSTFSMREYYRQTLLDMGFEEEKIVAALNFEDSNFNVIVTHLLRN